MAAGITVKLSGDKNLLKLLKKMTGSAQQRMIKPAITASLRPMRDAARNGAPFESRALKDSIGTKVINYRNAVVGLVGPRSGFKREFKGEIRKPHKYLHLVEFGTKNTSAKPFMRPAFAKTKGRSLSIFKRVTRERLIKFVKKNRKIKSK